MFVYSVVLSFLALLARVHGSLPGNDDAILQFALNLECLEGSFYSLVAYGTDLSAANLNRTGAASSLTTKYPMNIKPVKNKLAKEIADDEIAHVAFLRNGAGIEIPCPSMDLSADLWNFLATQVAATHGLSNSAEAKLNPYSEKGWLVGAFLFEDVGVTAYHGAAKLITDKNTVLDSAAGILAIEAYHAGAIRRIFLDNRHRKVPGMLGMNYEEVANAITKIRASLGNGGETPLTAGNKDNKEFNVPNDDNAIAYGRSVYDVIRIVTVNGATTNGVSTGGFFPAGMTGTFKTHVVPTA